MYVSNENFARSSRFCHSTRCASRSSSSRERAGGTAAADVWPDAPGRPVDAAGDRGPPAPPEGPAPGADEVLGASSDAGPPAPQLHNNPPSTSGTSGNSHSALRDLEDEAAELGEAMARVTSRTSQRPSGRC